jgi:hypothetical protein
MKGSGFFVGFLNSPLQGRIRMVEGVVFESLRVPDGIAGGERIEFKLLIRGNFAYHPFVIKLAVTLIWELFSGFGGETASRAAGAGDLRPKLQCRF